MRVNGASVSSVDDDRPSTELTAMFPHAREGLVASTAAGSGDGGNNAVRLGGPGQHMEHGFCGYGNT